ncbi:MAG: mechanosensitive ion channel family protein [Alicyclobacillaceae bacterium]|nr:mechanosensitive ion channel family protein [Alicyclobacillaceae bacterium]
MNTLWQHLHHELDKRRPSIDDLLNAFGVILEILLFYLCARVAIRICCKAIQRLMRSSAVRFDTRRRDTLESLLDNAARYVIYFIFILASLRTLGVHIAALLAGAGIAGVALGFGAQSLIRDVLTGFFILFEDQYGVGDLVKINGFTGTVVHIGLRTTRVKAWTGEIEIIPNGQVQQVTNYSKANSTAIVDVGVDSRTDLDRALQIMRQVLEELKSERDDVVGDVQVLGVQALTGPEIRLRVAVECLPSAHFAVERIARYRIKERFDREGIGLAGAAAPATPGGEASGKAGRAEV